MYTRIVIFALALVLLPQTVNARPLIVGALVDEVAGNDFQHRLVILDPVSGTELQSRVIASPLNATLSQDRTRLYVLNQASGQLRLETVDPGTLVVISSVPVNNLPIPHLETSFVEHPRQPGVLMLSRCWWLSATDGSLLETPQTLGVSCRESVRDNGLSSGGRYLLLDDEPVNQQLRRTVLVEVDSPRTIVRVFPYWSGPVLGDETSVATYSDGFINVVAIADGAVVRQYPLPSGWNSPIQAGSEANALFFTFKDPSASTFSLGRIALDSGAVDVPISDLGIGGRGTLELTPNWILYRTQTGQFCAIGGCPYTGSRIALFDRARQTAVRREWLRGGIESGGLALIDRGANAQTPIPSMRLVTMLLLVAIILLGAWAAHDRSRAQLGK